MNESRNFLMAFLLSVAVMVGFYQLYEKPRYEKAVQEQQLAAESLAEDKVVNNSKQPNVVVLEKKESNPILEVQNSARIKVANKQVSGSIRQIGAVFDDLHLNNYKETTDANSPSISLLQVNENSAYQMVSGWKTANVNESGKVPDQYTQWQLHGDNRDLTPETPVVLIWFNERGLKFERTISIDDKFLIKISDQVINHGEKEVNLQAYAQIQRKNPSAVSANMILHEGPIGYFDKKLYEGDYEKLAKEPVSQATTGGWLGFTDKYWLVSLMPDQKSNVKIEYLKHNGCYYAQFTTSSVALRPGESFNYTYHVYAGAKVLRVLDGYEPDIGLTHFDLAVDFGWFYFLTKPLFYALEYLHQALGNLGLAIILLTVLFRICLYPMATKSYRSMARMKMLQPKIQQVQHMYQNDKVRQSQELMALYKKEKINPAGGCLPMLIQAPIFFCLYKVLFVSIEMRHAPFIGWIHDLAAPDPTSFINLFGLLPFSAPSFLQIGIWPLLMGASMVIQQRMNPQPADPMQAKMMMLLPIMFTFLFASFPAGLVVYWTWNNILSMAQQWLITKQTTAK
jgi:YidC/Oxa1 family membrane protein insertase